MSPGYASRDWPSHGSRAQAFSGSACRWISGIWVSVKRTVSGMMPNTLKLTQKSVEKFRQTTSFSTASTKKKMPQRKRQLAPALVVEPEDGIEDVAEQRPAEEEAAEQRSRRTAR